MKIWNLVGEMNSPPSVIPIDLQGLEKDSGSLGMMAAADTKNDWS